MLLLDWLRGLFNIGSNASSTSSAAKEMASGVDAAFAIADATHATPSEYSEAQLLEARLHVHLKKIAALGDQYTSFIEQYLSHEIITMLSAAAAVKMTLTKQDIKPHSTTITCAPISYWLCTVPCAYNEAKQWFSKACDGYVKLLDQALSSDSFRLFQCELLVHIVFGYASGKYWVDMTILPITQQQFHIAPVMPVDLLTEKELALLTTHSS
jgi:hypothetical protein